MSDRDPFQYYRTEEYRLESKTDAHAQRDESTRLRHWRGLIQDTTQIILPALVLALVVHLFLAQATIVFGKSMEPNLHERQRLIIDKVSYRLHPPQRNDIVVINKPDMEEMLVKRIVGLPGETIEIHKGTVYIDGVPLPEPFPHDHGIYSMPPIMLGPLSYFVLGDNRDNSNDSRSFGPVKREHILGRVWIRYWPFNQLTQF
ncbi:MAG: signal peptidase I [Caldilineaceae bacterium]|jgi:signal peptidase I